MKNPVFTSLEEIRNVASESWTANTNPFISSFVYSLLLDDEIRLVEVNELLEIRFKN
tara:strand:- start:326 stop:496 length:171 start_codon:yes stop_codon:yes gene_type:complete